MPCRLEAEWLSNRKVAGKDKEILYNAYVRKTWGRARLERGSIRMRPTRTRTLLRRDPPHLILEMTMDIDARSFEAFRDLVYGRSGIVLGEGKQALVGSRIGKRMRQLGLTRFPEYLDWVKGRGGEEEMTLMLDAISTNVTSFFREPVHFEFLRARLEEHVPRRGKAAYGSGAPPHPRAKSLIPWP